MTESELGTAWDHKVTKSTRKQTIIIIAVMLWIKRHIIQANFYTDYEFDWPSRCNTLNTSSVANRLNEGTVTFNQAQWHLLLRAGSISGILGDQEAASRDYRKFVVKVYYKIENSPWALTLTEPVSEAFELPTSDWPDKIFFWQMRGSQVTLVCSYTT